MKLPSVGQILQGASRTFLRFPLVLCSAVIGTVSAVILMDHEGPEVATALFSILFASILGIPLLFGLAMIAEKREWGRWKSLGVQAFGIVLLAVYAFTVPPTLSAGPAYHVQRLLVLAIAVHLFVSVGPYLTSGEQNGFWHYNKTLLFRILGAALYTHILYLGLTLALAALDQLFGMEIPGKRYGELWIVTFGILNTWLFLAGVPDDLKSLDALTDYPKSLKVLVHYALAPLALIYVVIVYAYIAKIAVTWEWSEGWISKLILGLSITGMLSLILLHPVRDRDEAGWVKPAFRWFYVLMIPPVIMFPLALWRRISEFGVTESRYAAVILAAWLIFIVAYFLLSKGKSIKVIPVTLVILALAVSYGSWGMFDVSEQSQIERLRGILVRDSILVGDKIRKSPAVVTQADMREISSTLDYLHEVHGYEGIQQWFGEDLKRDTGLGWKEPELVAGMLGVEYVRMWRGGSGDYVTYAVNPNLPVDVNGYARMVRLPYMDRGRRSREVKGDGLTFELSYGLDTLSVIRRSGENELSRIHIDIRGVVAALISEYSGESVENVSPEKMTVSGEAGRMKVRVFLYMIQVRHREEALEISNISGNIAYSW